MERSFPVSAHATIDSEVLLVNKDAIFEILDNDTTVARRMLAGISACNRQLVNDIESISLQNSAQRLIGYLLQISAESPEPDHIQLPANKVTIASMLNITPETFSRVILKLQNAGLIEVSGRHITIANHNGLLNYK